MRELGAGLSGVCLTCAQFHSCAVLVGGAVKCWGRNNNGQIGDGTTTSRLTPVNVVGLGSGAASVALGAVR